MAFFWGSTTAESETTKPEEGEKSEQIESKVEDESSVKETEPEPYVEFDIDVPEKTFEMPKNVEPENTFHPFNLFDRDHNFSFNNDFPYVSDDARICLGNFQKSYWASSVENVSSPVHIAAMNGNVKLLDFLLKSGIYCIKEMEDEYLSPSLLASSLPNDKLSLNIVKRIHEAYDACSNNVVYCQSTYGYLACASCLKKTIVSKEVEDEDIVNIEDNYEALTQIENDYAENDLTSTDDQSEMTSYDEDESDDDFDEESGGDEVSERMIFFAKRKTD